MALAPIRGAPPGAPVPDFPTAEPRANLPQPVAASASVDQPPTVPVRQRHAPIEFSGGSLTFTFKVIPEQPAIARASLTVHIAAEAAGSTPSHTVGFLRMSASNARRFLGDLRSDLSPIVATGDEDGNVQIEYANTEAGHVLMVRTSGEQDVLHSWIIDTGFDLQAMADDLLADLGT